MPRAEGPSRGDPFGSGLLATVIQDLLSILIYFATVAVLL